MVFSLSEAETIRIADEFSVSLEAGDVVLLDGDLGAGKSVFARAVVRALTGDGTLEVPSPTFTLVQTYDTPRGEVYHFDLYRLKDPDEIFELGWEEALTGISLVEWPDRLGGYRPKNSRLVRFMLRDDGVRDIVFEKGTAE